MSDTWTWLNELATTPAGATGLISAAVALTGSLMTFCRVFLERRSNKIVARDNELRAYRRRMLQPSIEDADTFLYELDSLADIIKESRTKYAGMDRLRVLRESIVRADRPLYGTRLIAMAFPTVAIAGTEIHLAIRPLADLLRQENLQGARDWLIVNGVTVTDRVHRFHTRVEDELFGTGLERWLSRRAARARIRRYVRVGPTIMSRLNRAPEMYQVDRNHEKLQ